MSQSPSPTPSPALVKSHRGGEVILRAYNADGSLMNFEAFRRRQSNDKGEDGYDDVLLNSTTLTVALFSPLTPIKGATVRFDLPPGGPFTLNFSWPTSHGYSALMADIPGPGAYDIHELAARTLHEEQETRIAKVKETPSSAILSARRATSRDLEKCFAATDPADKGVQALQCLELAANAQLIMDRELAAAASGEATVGVTFTRLPALAQIADLATITKEQRRPAARLVIDNLDELPKWFDTVKAIHAVKGITVGQVCDSTSMGKLNMREWKERLNKLFGTLSSVDIWEIGNELGGNWLGDDVVEKVMLAARRARASSKTTMLTLYYQLGQDDEAHSVFTWAKQNLPHDLLSLVDIVGLSVYPQKHPLGTAADRILTTLGETFPGKKTAITELSYGAADLDDGPWWFGSPSDLGAARRKVIEQVTSAALARPEAWGAPLWWYYLDDESLGSPSGPVREALTKVATTRRS